MMTMAIVMVTMFRQQPALSALVIIDKVVPLPAMLSVWPTSALRSPICICTCICICICICIWFVFDLICIWLYLYLILFVLVFVFYLICIWFDLYLILYLMILKVSPDRIITILIIIGDQQRTTHQCSDTIFCGARFYIFLNENIASWMLVVQNIV